MLFGALKILRKDIVSTNYVADCSLMPLELKNEIFFGGGKVYVFKELGKFVWKKLLQSKTLL